MGSCLGLDRVPEDRRRGDTSASESRRGSGLSDSTSSAIHAAKNRPLRHERIRWKSDIPLTEGQLKSKRDEFWDTAPAFEGKAEIWMALKAATEAAEESAGSGEDHALAQAILDGAGVSLPHGSLVECYDELGTRYTIPVYCLSKPVNLLVDGEAEDGDSPAEFSEPVNGEEGVEVKLRIRLSLTAGKDVRLMVNSQDCVWVAKKKLQRQEKVEEPSRQRWYYGGKLLRDKLRIADAKVPPGHVIQCVVTKLDFDVIRTKK